MPSWLRLQFKVGAGVSLILIGWFKDVYHPIITKRNQSANMQTWKSFFSFKKKVSVSVFSGHVREGVTPVAEAVVGIAEQTI